MRGLRPGDAGGSISMPQAVLNPAQARHRSLRISAMADKPREPEVLHRHHRGGQEVPFMTAYRRLTAGWAGKMED